MRPLAFVCPCCGQAFRISETGIVKKIDSVSQDKPDDQLEAVKQALADTFYEFGATGGEKDG